MSRCTRRPVTYPETVPLHDWLPTSAVYSETLQTSKTAVHAGASPKRVTRVQLDVLESFPFAPFIARLLLATASAFSSKYAHTFAILPALDPVPQDAFPPVSRHFPLSRERPAGLASIEDTMQDNLTGLDEQLNPSGTLFVDSSSQEFARILGCPGPQVSLFPWAGSTDKMASFGSRPSWPLFTPRSLRLSSTSGFPSTRSSHALGLGISRFIHSVFRTQIQPQHSNTQLSWSVPSSVSPHQPASCLPTRDGCHLNVPRRCPASLRGRARFIRYSVLELCKTTTPKTEIVETLRR